MTVVILVSGGTGAVREQAIAAHIDPRVMNAAIIEGMPDGRAVLEASAKVRSLEIARVAPGCPCCTGNLTMRVTLNRLLKRAPARLYLSMANASHTPQVIAFLREAQYQEHLELGPEIVCD